VTLPGDMQKPRALGYRQDAPDERDYPAEQLLGATPPTVVPASMARFRVGTLEQKHAGSCVAFALTRAIDMALRAEAERRGAPNPTDLPLGAPGFLYFTARQQEVVDAMSAGRAPPTIRDEGSYPRLAMRAVQKLGFCAADAYSYEEALAHINSPPPAHAYRFAFDQSGLKYYRINSIGIARVAEVALALAQGHPVVFGMFVDSAFMRNRGERITTVATNDPDGGGHMMAVLDVTESEVVVDNWWGADWGDMGIGHLSHALFGSVVISDVYVIETCPPYSKESA
jgi:hypothetical protein